MEYPQRKRLRLRDFDYAENAYYYLTVCTKERKCVLSAIVYDSDGEAKVRLTECGKTVERRIKTIPGIDKYVIMPNHVHMIIRKENGKSVVSDMRSFKGLVTKKLGESIWQTSYYDHVIHNEKDYNEKWQYIDENPAKWAEDMYHT
ncbi:MAG: hypothetical protein Q3977_02665 [Oscillospiraceae bacterium]|nr:hypothetical protein [Oscillospiraceae bacterium]